MMANKSILNLSFLIHSFKPDLLRQSIKYEFGYSAQPTLYYVFCSPDTPGNNSANEQIEYRSKSSVVTIYFAIRNIIL